MTKEGVSELNLARQEESNRSLLFTVHTLAGSELETPHRPHKVFMRRPFLGIFPRFPTEKEQGEVFFDDKFLNLVVHDPLVPDSDIGCGRLV